MAESQLLFISVLFGVISFFSFLMALKVKSERWVVFLIFIFVFSLVFQLDLSVRRKNIITPASSVSKIELYNSYQRLPLSYRSNVKDEYVDAMVDDFLSKKECELLQELVLSELKLVPDDLIEEQLLFLSKIAESSLSVR